MSGLAPSSNKISLLKNPPIKDSFFWVLSWMFQVCNGGSLRWPDAYYFSAFFEIREWFVLYCSWYRPYSALTLSCELLAYYSAAQWSSMQIPGNFSPLILWCPKFWFCFPELSPLTPLPVMLPWPWKFPDWNSVSKTLGQYKASDVCLSVLRGQRYALSVTSFWTKLVHSLSQLLAVHCGGWVRWSNQCTSCSVITSHESNWICKYSWQFERQREGLAVKSTNSSTRWPVFESQHLYQVTQKCI